MQLRECHQLATGKGIKVAVLDTGCDFNHPDLSDRIQTAKDFTGSQSGSGDRQGHGTHCAGVIAASDDAEGMLGVAYECSLLIGKVLGDDGSGRSDWINAGIEWALRSGAEIISMSLGGGGRDPHTTRLLMEAARMGVLVFAAFGNEGPGDNTGGWPGRDPNAFGIGAYDSNMRIASFSSRGPEIDFCCPGVRVRSCYPNGQYAVLSGTSMATPYAAGCAALVLSHVKSQNGGQSKLTPKELYARFRDTAKDIEAPGFDRLAGYGGLQPLEVLRSLAPTPPTPAPPGRGRIVLDFDGSAKNVVVTEAA